MYSVADTLAGGFPHSDMLGSKNAPISPSLFAGCHVLHRLLSPRHSPGALIALENPYTRTSKRLRKRITLFLNAHLGDARCEDTLSRKCHASTPLLRPEQARAF